MGFIEWLISVVYKSLFLSGDSGYRKAYFLAKVIFILSIALFISRSPSKVYLLIPVIIILGYFYPGRDWIIAVLTLTAFTGAFLSISSYLLSLIGLYHMDLVQIPEIIMRAVGVGVSIVFSFMIISPIELYNAIFTFRGRKYAVFPLLLWKLIPHGLKNFIDSIVVGYLKREYIVKRIPTAVASLLETDWLIEEYCYWRLRVPTKTIISLERSYRHTLTLLMASLVITLIQYLI